MGEGYCREPFRARSIVNISGMSFGAISAPAVRALSRGAAGAGCWLDTGEGGLSPYHLEGGCDIIMQIGTARYGIRDHAGEFSPARARELAKVVKAFEIKLSQGAKPGKGGVLPGAKVMEEIARIRGIPVGIDSISPNRHPDIPDMATLLDRVAYLRDLTGRPVGVKTAIGGWAFMNELCELVLRRGLEHAPDFLVIDGGEGGSGAAPQTLADHMSLPIAEALPRVVDALLEAGLKERVRVVLQRGPVVEEKYLRVANYCRSMNQELDTIAHSCGCRHARELRREHVRIVESATRSEALSMLYPYPEAGSGRRAAVRVAS